MGFLDRKNLETKNEKIGSKSVKVIVAPRPQKKSFLQKIIFSLLSLFNGMKVTLHYFVRPKTWVTQQYPENKKELKMFDRYRAELKLKYDENGYHSCTGCKICDKVCPNASIEITEMRGAVSKKKELDRFIWLMDTCTFCNLCVIVCPHDALEMTPSFESSVYDRRLLGYQLNTYSGPVKKFLDKLDNKEEAQKMMQPRKIFEGNTYLSNEIENNKGSQK